MLVGSYIPRWDSTADSHFGLGSDPRLDSRRDWQIDFRLSPLHSRQFHSRQNYRSQHWIGRSPKPCCRVARYCIHHTPRSRLGCLWRNCLGLRLRLRTATVGLGSNLENNLGKASSPAEMRGEVGAIPRKHIRHCTIAVLTCQAIEVAGPKRCAKHCHLFFLRSQKLSGHEAVGNILPRSTRETRKLFTMNMRFCQKLSSACKKVEAAKRFYRYRPNVLARDWLGGCGMTD